MADFTWKGYGWNKRTAGGGPHFNGNYSTANVIGPDGSNFMTLRITNPSGTSPIASEFASESRDWGYGTYITTIGTQLDTLNKSVVFGGLFTYDPDTPIYQNEIDVNETSAWGENSAVLLSHTYWKNVGGVNTSVTNQVAIPSDTVQTHRLIWRPSQLTFDSFKGTGISGELILHTERTQNIPTPAQEYVIFNLWVYAAGPADETTVPQTDVIIRDFSFTPYQRIDATPRTIQWTRTSTSSRSAAGTRTAVSNF